MEESDFTRTPANDRIVLIRVKIERAKKHFRDLEDMMESTRNKYRDTRFRDRDKYFTDMLVIYRANLPVYRFEALAIAGDLVHNLRSALDHLAYELALAGSGRTPSRLVGFPIAKSLCAYECHKVGKVKGMRPEAVEFIDRLKPYRGGCEPLWQIHSLDNADKHRHIFTIGEVAVYGAKWWDGEFLLKPRFFKTDDPTFSRADAGDVQENMDLPTLEAFGDSEIVKCDALLPTMKQLIDFVEALIPDFEPFLR